MMRRLNVSSLLMLATLLVTARTVPAQEQPSPAVATESEASAGDEGETGVADGQAGGDRDESVPLELPETMPGPTMTLTEVLEATDQNSLALTSARLEITKAEAKLKQAYALILPGAEASMQFMHKDHEDVADFTSGLADMGIPLPEMEPMVVSPQQDLKGTIGVGMSVINLKNWMTIGLAKRGVELARAMVEDGRRQALLMATEVYMMALSAKELIALKEETVRAAAHHVEVARIRFEAGTGLRIDVLRAETSLDEERQSLIAAHLAFENARDALAVLTGAEGLPIPVDSFEITPPEGDDEKLSRAAMATRPDYVARRASVELAEKQLDVSWMQFVPTLDAAWQLNYQFTKPADLGSPDRSRWAAVLTLTVPIYNHFRYGDLDEKRAALEQARLNMEDTEQQISMKVRQARRDYLSALTSVEIAERQNRLANEALELVLASYEAGTGTSLEVTDARKTASMAGVNYTVKRLDAKLALAKLLDAIGTDLTTLKDK